MTETPEQKNSEKWLIALCLVSFSILVLIQIFLPYLSPAASSDDEIQKNYRRIHLVMSAGITVGLIQLLISVQLVNIAQKTGFLISLCINLFNVLIVLQAFFIQKKFSALPGIVISVVAVFLCWLDYKQQKKIQDHVDSLREYTYIDDLTGLPNRKERIATITDLISGENKIPAFSLLMFDLDNFKRINDTLGHKIGDLMIQEIVHNLKKFITEPATFGRIGGDEFLIILPEAISETEIETYAMEVSKIISEPFYYQDKDYRMSASFGIARYPKDSENPAKLMSQVDIALFRAKAQGKNKIEFFDAAMQTTLETQANLDRNLSTAIEKDELYMEFQPQYYISDKKLRGFEVLARWTSPSLGRITPQDFIPLAEENGLIVSIGKWLIKKACYNYSRLISSYEEHPMLAVNISVVQFRDPDFLEFVKNTIRETGINTKYVEFEITESVCIQSPEVARHIISELKNMGITIALDDFGSGYSSLSYLRSLPLDVVKIDKSFIDMIGKIPDEKNIVKSIVEMAHKLDLEVIAEGIENEKQFNYLKEVGCDVVQGNLLGKPAPLEAL